MGSFIDRFVRPELCHKETIEKIRIASRNRIYTYTFPTLYCWAEDEDYRLYIENDAFLVKNGARGDNAYLGPCGTEEGKKRLVEALLQEERSPIFYFLGEDDVAFFERCFPEMFTFEECRDDFSYIFDRWEQIKIKGDRFKHIRHKIHQNEKTYSWNIEQITSSNKERAIAINAVWKEEKNEKGDTAAANKALYHIDELNMWGLLFQADGKDVAYVLGSFVTPEIFDSNFNKTILPDIDHYVRWKIFQNLPESINDLDSEEDMGIEGLREHKLRRIPSCIKSVWKGCLSYE